MVYKFTIPGRLQGFNEYTHANRTSPKKGGTVKRDSQDIIVYSIRQYLRGVHVENPVLIYYRFYEPNGRRDNDNILACAAKFIQDSLVNTKVLINDSQKYIHNFYFDTLVDKWNPRIEVTITELTDKQAGMMLIDILKELDGD